MLPLSNNPLGPHAIDWSKEDTHRNHFEDGIGKLNDVNPHTFLEEYLTLDNVTSTEAKPAAFTLNRGGRRRQTPYSFNMAKYQQMMSLVTSDADQAKVDSYFNECIQSLYAGKRSVTEIAKVQSSSRINNEEVNGEVCEKDVMVSGPNVETCPKKRRFTSSPQKKKGDHGK